MNNPVFSPDSFWNTPIPDNPEIDEKSGSFIKLLETTVSPKKAVYINHNKWTIPVYRVQKYGMVNVDVAGGICIYLENLNNHPGLKWDGLVDSGWILEKLGLTHLRVLKLKDVRNGGLKRTRFKW